MPSIKSYEVEGAGRFRAGRAKRFPVYVARKPGFCGHQHSRLGAAFNCAGEGGRVFRVTADGVEREVRR